MRTPIRERLTLQNPPLLYDGAKGTFLKIHLSEKQIDNGTPVDVFNVEKPTAVTQLLTSYVSGGSQFVQTCTFCSNKYGLEKTDYANNVRMLNQAATRVAREAVGDDIYVAGDIGPLGKKIAAGKLAGFLKDDGTAEAGYITFAEAVAAYEEQVHGLLDGNNIDLLHVETIDQIDDMEAALRAIANVTKDRNMIGFPTIATMNFKNIKETVFKTNDGAQPSELIELVKKFQVLAYGANCGSGTQNVVHLVEQLRNGNDDALLVMKMNAGKPVIETSTDGKITETYPGTPEEMAEYAILMHENNVKVIGACCGSGPEHISAMANALQAAGALTS